VILERNLIFAHAANKSNIEKSICEESCIVFSYITWNTVSKALVIESKFDVGLPSGKLN
jgi:hypothetical protein